jgi:hypothetical protein
MDNPETLPTLGTQDTGRRLEKIKGAIKNWQSRDTANMLAVSLDCPFLIASLIFSNVYIWYMNCKSMNFKKLKCFLRAFHVYIFENSVRLFLRFVNIYCKWLDDQRCINDGQQLHHYQQSEILLYIFFFMSICASLQYTLPV